MYNIDIWSSDSKMHFKIYCTYSNE